MFFLAYMYLLQCKIKSITVVLHVKEKKRTVKVLTAGYEFQRHSIVVDDFKLLLD
jgi:hypothetical protein